MKTFEELGLGRGLLAVLSSLNIKTPTEIQEKTIPLVLSGRDVIGGSSTGSGKTLVFASSIVQNLKKNGRVQSLILTPTRELAEQISVSIRRFAKYEGLSVLAVYGGTSMDTQIRMLSRTDVVVGTPGRILDHLRRGTLNLGQVRFLVLDEVDRMFDMGFQKDVEMILDECPKKRQTMLFSATLSAEMNYLSQKYTHNPVEVSVASHVDPSKLKQIYYNVPDGLKFSLFVHLLKQEKSKLVMVFCGTRRNVDFVANNLEHLGIKAKAIHGGMLQNKRNKVMEEFNSKAEMNVLVCTDVAARGLDIEGVSHVYNYDLPKTSSEYIHRIGRTARAGKEGIAINVLCSRDYENFSNILKDEKLHIEEAKTPWFEKVNIRLEEKRGYGNRGDNDRRGPRRSYGGGNQSGSRERSSGPRRSSSGGSYRRGTSSPRRDDSKKSYESRSSSPRRDGNEKNSYGGRGSFGSRRGDNNRGRNFSKGNRRR